MVNLSRVSRAAIVAACLAGGVLGLTSCAQDGAPVPTCNAALTEASSSIVWPAAPDKARVAYVGILQDNTNCARGEAEQPLALSYPKGIATSPDGLVYTSDRNGVRVFDAKKARMSPFADQAPNQARNARGLAVAPDGRVFVADAERRRVLVYSAENRYLGEIGTDSDIKNPQGLAIDANRGRLYVADAGLDAVQCFSLDGTLLFSIASTPKQVIGVPTQVAVNSHGEVYVVHQGIPKVLAFDADGKALGGFGREGVVPGTFVRPKGIAIDSEDHVYVSDAAFDNVQVFDRQGQLLLVVGQSGGGKGELNLPFMLTIDKSDRIYVAEFGNHRVQVLQYLSGQGHQ